MISKNVLKIIILLTCFFTYSPVFSESLIITTENSDNIVKIDKNYYLPLTMKIPDKSYIYGNPKGPGTGKPTNIFASTSNKSITFSNILIEKPEKYFPKQEINWVYRHKDSVKFYVPFTITGSQPNISITIKILVDALLCSNVSCVPIKGNYSYTFNTDQLPKKSIENKDNFLKNLVKLGGNTSTVNTLKPTKTKKLQEIPFDFEPKFITTNTISNLLQAIIFALLAGFILNFMPCVLPVISLKIISIIKIAKDDRLKIIKIGLTFTLGMLLSFLVLASLAAFAGHNWGTLFQNTTFLISMIIIVFALALSLMNVYTINLPSFAAKKATITYSNPYIDAFMKGLLTTFLATPCSGPFLGGTLAWSLTQPIYIIYIIFLCIGLGMALPYLIIALKPGLISFIPKPGEWTVVFEKLMGFLLFGTVIYLLSVLPLEEIPALLWMLFFTAIAFWQYGQYGAINKSKKSRIFSAILLVIIIYAAYSFFLTKPGKDEIIDIPKENYSLEKLTEANVNNQVVIVKFTADWCPNCQLVELNTIKTKEFNDLVKENNIKVLIADITKPGTEAEMLLNKLNSRSIPFLAIFGTGENFLNPICLRDLYNIDDIKEALDVLDKTEKKEQLEIPEIKVEDIKF